MKKQVLLLGIFSFALASLLHAQTAQYTVIELGVPGANSRAMAINDAGQVVGSSIAAGATGPDAILFSGISGGAGNITLNTLPEAIYSGAYGISSQGSVAGIAQDPTYRVRAVAFGVGGGNAIDLSESLEFSTFAYGINSGGRVVGETVGKAVAFESDGAVTYLGSHGGYGSSARAINEIGQIAGYAQTSAGQYHATLFSGTGSGNIDLDPTGAYSAAFAINNAGQIVGHVASQNGMTAALFSADGNPPVDLGTLGGANSTAYGINDSGLIVGDSEVSPGVMRGFIFKDNTMVNLTDLTGTAVVPWISSATAINAWGQIAANYSSPDGNQTRALLLNPSTPLQTQNGQESNAKVVAGVEFSKTAEFSGSGGYASVGRLLDGTATANRDITAVIDNSAHPGLVSDVFDISGTGSDTFVLQLSYDEAAALSLFGSEADVRLLWFDGDDWVNAVEGNAGGTSFFAGDGAYEAATDFVLGTYGVDTVHDVVWAVINHNSEFAVAELAELAPVPEPGTALFALAVSAVAGGRRRRQRRP